MTLDIILAWLVILLLLTAFSVLLVPEPKQSKKAILTREGESVMGQHIKNHKPRRTIHTIVNSMAGEAAPSMVMLVPNLLQREEIPDVSFWQGVIDWAKMATKTRKVIIRAGQNKWVDICFKVNYAAAKLFGLLRGVYFFYDGRVSPSEQLETLKEALDGDMPELGIWVDWEKNFGGAHEGLRNVVAFMQIIERAFPGVEVGIYTGYWFFRENSNPIWNAAQYTYLAAHRLWLAFYAALSSVLIPAPWGRMKYWQFGTPAVGLEWGVSTKEIDMNEHMEDDGDPIPPQPEPEEPNMKKGTVKTGYTLTVRDANGADTGVRLRGGDVVYGEVVNGRITFARIYQGGVTVVQQAGNASTGTATEAYMTLIDVEEPAPPAPVPALRARLTGAIAFYQNGVKTHETEIDVDVPLDAVG